MLYNIEISLTGITCRQLGQTLLLISLFSAVSADYMVEWSQNVTTGIVPHGGANTLPTSEHVLHNQVITPEITTTDLPEEEGLKWTHTLYPHLNNVKCTFT